MIKAAASIISRVSKAPIAHRAKSPKTMSAMAKVVERSSEEMKLQQEDRVSARPLRKAGERRSRRQ